MRDDNVDLAAMARDIRYLCDRAQIQDCVAKYCRGLDRLDDDTLRDAFHGGAVYHHADFHGARNDFTAWAIALMAETAGSHHSITTQLIDIDGDAAHSESYCVFRMKQADGSRLQSGAARYIDRLERREGRWGIATRVVVVDFGWEQASSAWYGDPQAHPASRRDCNDYAYRRPLASSDAYTEFDATAP